MLLVWLYFLINFSKANDPDHTMVIEAHKDLELYVAPVTVVNKSKGIEAFVSDYSAFAYASTHWKNAKIYNGNGGYETITLNHEGFKVYNEDTIKYAWDECDYSKDPKACSYQNNHYLLETFLVVTDQEFLVNMMLYDSDLQVISTGSVSIKKVIKWIKQQAVSSETTNFGGSFGGSNCSGNTCSRPRSNSRTTVSKPKEEMPLKWEMPHRMLDEYVHQASLLLWCSTNIKEL